MIRVSTSKRREWHSSNDNHNYYDVDENIAPFSSLLFFATNVIRRKPSTVLGIFDRQACGHKAEVGNGVPRASDGCRCIHECAAC